MKTTENSPARNRIYLKDYQAPEFEILNVFLDFNLDENSSLVTARWTAKKTGNARDLILDGEELTPKSVLVNGKASKYEILPTGLKVLDVPDQFEVTIQTELKPQDNSALEGLYKSNGIFCTQCEAQSFRRITYFLDRPDVMTKYQVRIEADEKKYPILLSNGDRISKNSLGNGRHEVIWSDPHKKPCYLFALVAGDLGVIKDSFTTVSGKKVELEVYAAHGKQDRCHHAMDSLKKSMKWDEGRFGREYDLATYMIVAVDDFNAGAMENKGLNIFNSRLVFADAKTATDMNYFMIESVIAHEYFHNWTGNRVTVRDWFHLSLKEGLTVFRDQEFSMDQSSRALIRIDNVNDLRNAQFAEDAGPNAHPIRPAYCYSVDNFFTSTIYEKGAEIIRMMQTMVGRPGFRKGMDLYFKRHDGDAVVTEDFANSIAEPNQQNWDQFKLWYSQAGTPTVDALECYDANTHAYTLTLKQSCTLTSQERAEGIHKKPFHIPMVIGLLDQQGNEIPIHCDKVVKNTDNQTLVHLHLEQEEFVFTQVAAKPVLSLNRQFSAPIHLKTEASLNDLVFLMKYDTDEFNRWESAQKIYLKVLAELILEGKSPTLPIAMDAVISILNDDHLDPDFKASLLKLPDIDYLAQMQSVVDGPCFQRSIAQVRKEIATVGEKALLKIYQELHGKNVLSRDPKDFGLRRLKNMALGYLAELPQYQQLAMKQFNEAQIMTDQQAALGILVDIVSPTDPDSAGPGPSLREQAIQKFHQQWQSESLILNPWFAQQAASSHPKTFETVKALLTHPDFNIKNPNRVYSLLRNFGDNISQFHQGKKETYTFMAEQILILDKINPQVAARIAGCFDLWTKLPDDQKKWVRSELERLLSAGLSSNTHEIIKNALEA